MDVYVFYFCYRFHNDNSLLQCELTYGLTNYSLVRNVCNRFHTDSSLPVSYTHLDVYKRQAIENSMSVDFGEDRLRGKGSLPETFFVVT